MSELDFIKTYIQSALARGLNTGTRATLEELAGGLSEEHLTQFIAILSGVLEKKKDARKVSVRQVK
jgi:hypothetical protein